MANLIARFLAILSLVLWASPSFSAWGTPTNLAVTANAAPATLTSGSVTVPSGVLVIVGIFETAGAGGTGTLADAGGNTYSSIPLTSIDGKSKTYLFWAYNVTGFTGNITYTKGQGGPTSLSAMYISGSLTSSQPQDVSQTATLANSTPTVTSPSPSLSGELFVGIAVENTGTNTFTQASGWVSPPNAFPATGGNAIGGNLINAGSSAQTYNPSLSGTSSWSAIIVSFKVAAGGGATCDKGGLLLLGVGC